MMEIDETISTTGFDTICMGILIGVLLCMFIGAWKSVGRRGGNSESFSVHKQRG